MRRVEQARLRVKKAQLRIVAQLVLVAILAASPIKIEDWFRAAAQWIYNAAHPDFNVGGGGGGGFDDNGSNGGGGGGF